MRALKPRPSSTLRAGSLMTRALAVHKTWVTAQSMLSATSATTRSRQGAAPARPRNVGAIIVQNDVDLAHLEAGDFQIELRRQFEDLGKLQDERLAVPGGIFGDPIERQPQRP